MVRVSEVDLLDPEHIRRALFFSVIMKALLSTTQEDGSFGRAEHADRGDERYSWMPTVQVVQLVPQCSLRTFSNHFILQDLGDMLGRKSQRWSVPAATFSLEVQGARDLQGVQGVQAEVTADVAVGGRAPRRSNRLRVRTLARGVSLEFPPTNFPGQLVLSRAYTT